MDTSKNSVQNKLINFYGIHDEETYEELDKIYLFSVRPQTIHPINTFTKEFSLDRQIVNLNSCFWVLESIKFKDQTIQLDSCHATYELAVDKNGTYKQHYANEVDYCNCLISKPIIKEENYDLGLNQGVLHKLRLSSGEVRAYEQKLPMSNLENDELIEFDYETAEGKLILKTSNNYVISLKINPACNNR